MENYSQELLILLNILIATVLTGLVGLEREKAEKPAGFRTNMIVGGTTCFLVNIVSILIPFYHGVIPEAEIQADPVRVIEAVIVGISFLGAGTIIKSNTKNEVTNLTTAATLLYSAAIGISVGLKQYILGAGLTVLALIINYLIRFLENKIK